MDSRGLSCRLPRARKSFRPANGLFIQFPLVNSFLTSFAREIRVHLPFGLFKDVFRVGSSAPGSIVRFFHFFEEGCNLSVHGRPFLPAVFSGNNFVSSFQIVAPAGFRSMVQFVERGVGAIGDLAHPALLKKPCKDGPLHGLGHQFPGFFDLRKFSHGAKTITTRVKKVQRAAPEVGAIKFEAALYA